MHPGRTPEEETRALWYELGSLYAGAGGSGHRATKLGFTVVCVVGALVLLLAPLLGTAWAGPFAPAIPVATGLLSGSGLFVWERTKVRRRTDALGRTLSERGLDAERPAKEGLGAYHDTQLILLRSEYEYLRLRRAEKSARLFEETFGFTTEDPFETGPLNVTPDTGGMLLLRERWERRLAARRQHGMEPPALGMREDLAYSVFPREMTLAEELATRRAYLGISRELLLKRYGREPGREKDHLPDAIRRRMERDLSEYAALTERQARRS